MTVESPTLIGGQISTLATQQAWNSVPSVSISPSQPALQLTNHPKKEETPPLPVLHLQTPSPKLRVTEVIDLTSPIAVIQQSSSIINLVTPSFKSKCLQTPSPKLCFTEVINLVSPNDVIQKPLISLVTPPFKSKCLQTPSPKLHFTEVINLVSPNDVTQKPTSTINPITPLSEKRPKHNTSIELPLNVLSKQKSTAIDVPVHACESRRFPSLDAAIIAVCDEEERLGHKWVKGQTKKTGGEVRHITMCCNHYRLPTERHSVAIDPANHRRGRSNKTDCKAHVNIIRETESGLWILNVPDWVHNHAPEIPSGGNASRPPTKKLQDAISTIATTTNLDRADISTLIKQHPEYDSKHPLEPRQITNMVNAARRNARNEVIGLGGDVNAVVGWLRERTDQGWKYRLQIDDDQVVVGIWWQSPRQVELTR